MYNLSLHIEYLLLRHDCVILPGFGAFINVRKGARFDEATQTWYPMTREIRFNKALIHDDGLLANSYARKNKLSFHEGRELLRRDIELMKRQIKEQGETTVGQLGILSLNENTIVFHPLHSSADMATMMGFAKAPVNIEVSHESEISETFSNHSERSEKAEGSKLNSKFNTRKNYYIPVNKIFAKTAACLAFIIAVAIGIILPVSNYNIIDKASVFPLEKLIPHFNDNSESNNEPLIEVESSVGREPHPQDTSFKEETVVEIPATEPSLYVIVATFDSAKEAEKFISSKESKDYDLTIVSTRTKARVAAYSSDDREELQNKMREQNFRNDFPGSWIWEK